MKLIVLLFLLRSFSAASFISFDELGTLFKNLMLNQLSEEDNTTLQDAFEILRRPEFITVTPLDKSSKLRMSIDCLVCRSIAVAFVASVQSGTEDVDVIDLITTLCYGLGVETYEVCKGAASLNVPVINHIIRSTPWDLPHPQVFCGLILQTAMDPSVCPYDDPRFDWQVELPEKSIMKNKAPVSKHESLKVAIITDAHIDPLYEAYGVADCDAPTCCKKGQSPRAYYQTYNTDATLEESLNKVNGETKLDLSDASKIRELNNNAAKNAKTHNSAPAGYWGDYRNCDSPMWAFEDAIENIKENHQDIDVLYYIGDTIDHAVWETSYDLLINMHRYVADKIRETFGDDISVVPVIGNHETQPTNQYAPNSVTETVYNTTWLYNVLADKWSHYLPAQAQASLRQHGSYSLLVRPGLRVIALNNNVAYKFNWWLMYNPRDCKKQLDWLIQELHQAELDGVKVHILAHIPPGTHDLIYTWTREYNRIVNRFSSTIAAEFNGHSHADEFKIFYSSDNGNPINVAWGGGGIVTYSNFNLNYKIVDINAKTYMPENIFSYIYNLTEANLTPERRPYWYLLYDMKNSFGINDLTPNSINNLVLSMVTTHRRSLDLYVAYYFKLSDELWPKCDDTCKIETLCDAVVTVLWEREKCEHLKDLILT